MFKKLPGVIIFLILFLGITINVVAVQVQPLVINLDLSPGDSTQFELKLTGGMARDTVRLEMMHPVQNLSGSLSYQEIDSSLNPAIDWVELERTEVAIPANEEVVVKGYVNIPFDAGGSYTAIIMVDNVEPIDSDVPFMRFQLRYAVRLNMNINRPGQRADVEILDLTLEPDNAGKPIISVHFKNTSPLRFPAVADVTIRGEDRRLIERVPVFSQATHLDRRENFSVFPNSELIYRGEISKSLFPGTYELQLFFRYADGRQIVKRQIVEIEEGFLREESLRYLAVDPQNITMSVIPGATSTQILTLSSQFSEPLLVRTFQTDLSPEYSQSIFSAQELDLRGHREFKLNPRGTTRQLLTFRVPRDLNPGGYYGYHDIEVYNLEQEKLETHRINLISIIQGDILQAAEILDLNHNSGDFLDTFSVTLKNTGNIHINPQVGLQLFDAEEVLYLTLNLTLQDEDKILPAYSSFLTAESRYVEQGDYTAVLSLVSEGEELDSKEFSLAILRENQ